MLDSPSAALLIAEARTALDAGVAPGFPQKVVANALGIAQRELELGPAMAEGERARLRLLLGEDGEAAILNRRLAEAIRAGGISLDAPALLDHLIPTTVAKLEVDQPAYRAFRAWKGG